ncbi:Cytochrome P450 71D10 [Apostasia shenzhenica]|uniref:Cytochrome P450 71D10 n=1 Tax=Apostasia shenzhenica TaxID=1088818 RepID=A0A2I0B5C0_9ASPA|nr:Cytochrome P450 71D10 [Apostasia shenzhenica]
MELVIISIALILITAFLRRLRKLNAGNAAQLRRSSGKQVPGPWNLPVVGGIHRLLGPRPPHHYLRLLSLSFGPIMRLKLGEINAVIISSSEGAREIMKTHDVAFASRPTNATTDKLLYGSNDIIFGRQGDFWHQMRRICTLELLSSKRVRSFRAIREEEVSNLIRYIAAAAGDVVDLSSKFAEVANDITARAVIGGKCSNQRLFLSALHDAVVLASGLANVFNLFPSLPGFVGRIAGFQQKAERCHQKLDGIAEKILEEHRRKRRSCGDFVQKVSLPNHDIYDTRDDILDVLLRIQQDGGLRFPLTTDHIKAVVNDMLMAGSETSATTLEWAMSELVRHPEAMSKAQREVEVLLLDANWKTKLIIDEDILTHEKLSYLRMVIKETFRLHPPVPLLLPRENQERCEVMGYDIPAKTTVMVNAWAIGRDPAYWEEPEAFRPERFERSGRDFKGADFEFIPFGSGRRICPGIHFGLAIVEMVMANLLYYFDWERVGGTEEGEELDMAETFGLAAKRKTPLCLLARPRIPFHAE